MKENEAPEKIYLQVCGDCPQIDCESCKFEDFEDNITWCKDRIFPKDIEYIRTDAFIEKAKKWFEENFMNVHRWEISTYEFENIQSMIDEFRNYMKGE